MAEESRGVALAILGIVAVIAIIGLVLLFKMKATGDVYGGGLIWGEGGWQSEGLSTRMLYAPQTPGGYQYVTGGGKLGPEVKTAGPYLKNYEPSFYGSEIPIYSCQMGVATGWLEPGYTVQIAKNSRRFSEYTSCYGVNKPWPEGFVSEAIPGYCCKEIERV
ncbi:MAG: hypothetical protein QW666_02670 [Candidatus Woesearchaeota archaeon]